MEFNEAIRQACGNSVLGALATTLEKRARFYFAMVEDRLGSDWVSIEQELLLSIERRDADAAATIARNHIHNTGAEVMKLLAED